jgi:hypothetical protein
MADDSEALMLREGPRRALAAEQQQQGALPPPDERLMRQGLAELPATSPGFMSVPSDTSNLPSSESVEDRRQPGMLQQLKDSTSEYYMATRELLGLDPRPGSHQFLDVKNPDERLGTAQDIRDRVGVIRERHQQVQDAYDNAHVQYKADLDAYHERQNAGMAEQAKYHESADKYLADLQTASAKGQAAKFLKSRGSLPPPPSLKNEKGPDPEKYFGDLSRFRLYNKFNPE